MAYSKVGDEVGVGNLLSITATRIEVVVDGAEFLASQENTTRSKELVELEAGERTALASIKCLATKTTSMHTHTNNQTKRIRSWSEGEMSNDAFQKVQSHWSDGERQNAESMLSEWILNP